MTRLFNLVRDLNKKQRDKIFLMFLLIPALTIFSFVIIYPIFKSIWMSFHNFTIFTIQNPKWVGLQNYIELFSSGEIFVYFKNTLVFVFFSVTIQFLLALSIALLLDRDIKWRGVHRGLFLLPWAIPSVVVAMLWIIILHPQYGVLNFILYNLGLISSPDKVWTLNPDLAMYSVVIATVWRWTPFMIMMILAALQSVPEQLTEAARIDGANPLRVLWHVILPTIRPVIVTAVILGIIMNFQLFTIIYNMTQGGPMNRTTTLSIGTYKMGFLEYNFGQAAAIGVVWLLSLIIMMTIYNKNRQRIE